ncbi:MAG: hypothetical protein WDO06_00775 [Actinomycetota bacterium]
MKYLRSWLLPIIALAIAFAIGALMMKLEGANPLKAYQTLFTTAFGSTDGIAKTIWKGNTVNY